MRPSKEADTALKGLRKAVMAAHRIATTAGYGPRYLHSTGQLHKGGPSKGIFLQLIGDMAPDIKIPDATYGFGTLAQAQAVGDLQSLQAHGRPVVRVELGRRGVEALQRLIADVGGRAVHRRASRSSRR
jgi:glucose-6-phosphate isomerase/transaldolase/glucose-6-phosphate isomerase